MDRIRMFNRWSTVLYVQESDNLVHVAVRYDDGTKRILKIGLNEGWFVKKDSLPEPTTPDISEDADGIKIEGTLTEEGMAYAEADAEMTTELTDGPLVRAIREEFKPRLIMERTVTKTTNVKTFK